MATEHRGKVKLDAWTKQNCMDDTPRPERSGALGDFKTHSVGEEEPIHVAAADVLEELQELAEIYEPPDDDGA